MRALLAAIVICVATGASAAPTISAGTTHGLAARADGTVLAWGGDDQGELGQGALVQSSVPRALAGVSDIASVAVGDSFALALTRGGRVYSWGSNVFGQLGDGTQESRSDPRLIASLSDVVAVAASWTVGLAVKRDGTVWSWGLFVSSAIGREPDRFENSLVPGQIPGLTNVRAIWANRYGVIALRGDGTLWAWGEYTGDGTSTERDVPVQVQGLTNVVSAVVGHGKHSLALLADGTVRAWGRNDSGQLGDGTRIERLVPVPVVGLAGVRSLGATYSASAAVLNDGTVMTWGSNAFTMLGIGPTSPFVSDRATPGVVPGLSGMAEVAGGEFNFVARRQSGEAVAWGDNEQGQLGDGTTLEQGSPVPVAGLAQATMIAAGDEITYAVLADGSVRGWGSNRAGMLTVARIERYSTPQVVRGVDGVTAVAAGYQYSLALRSDGTVWGWGANDQSQLGDGTTTPRSTPVQVAGVSGVVGICAGLNISAALRSDGTVWIWSFVRQGIDGSYFSAEGRRAIILSGLADVASIACGNAHLLALRRDGTVWAVGYNDEGQLGRGTTSLFERNPAPVPGVAGVVSLAGGYDRSFAVTGDGSLYAWGSGRGTFVDVAMLGNGSTASRPTAFRVNGVSDAVMVASARHDSHSFVILRDGSVFAWGANYYGALGDGSTVNRGFPVSVAKVFGIAEIEAGGGPLDGFSLARYPGGGVLGWGSNYDGKVADGTFSSRVTAVASSGVGGVGVLDVTPATPSGIPAEFLPAFGLLTTAAGSREVPTINALVNFRPADVGSTGSVFVFALAPAFRVQGGLAKSADPRFAWKASGVPKADPPVPCALAQLNAQGQLVAVSAASLHAYVSGVLSAQGQSVAVLSGTPASSVEGATFFVGYGANGDAMLTNGTTRSVVSVPGTTACQPQPPQTGWWYNPAEGGRGFSIEARGNQLFFAAFHYEADGRPTWNFAGGATSLDGSLFTSGFLAASGGQTLTGNYRLPSLANAGAITFAFSDATHGTMFWPGGSVAIERQPFVPDGLTAAPQPGLPQSGWWWNPAESGRGFFIEWQGGFADVAGYMYDAQGRPTWYIAALPTPDPLRITGNWWTFANGQAMGQPYRPATRTSDNAGALDIRFTSPTTAIMSLPDGRQIPLVRQAF